MPASPAPADNGRDDGLAWPDRDPMTAAEREASLDRLCEQDEGHLEDEDESGDVEPLTPGELAEIREAAADELLAVEAATTGRRGPGHRAARRRAGPRRRGQGPGPGRPADPRRAARRDRSRGDGGGPGEGAGTPGDGGEGHAGGAVGRGLGQRRADGLRAAPDEVLAADQRITAWAKELRRAGLEGGMDMLRARAFLDLLLGQDARPRQDAGGAGPGSGGSGPDTPPSSAGPAGGAVSGGFAGRVTLTVPLATITGLADRPGELGGIGPVDPWLARGLARAAARNPSRPAGTAPGGCALPDPGPA
jgi:hypothetical protein